MVIFFLTLVHLASKSMRKPWMLVVSLDCWGPGTPWFRQGGALLFY